MTVAHISPTNCQLVFKSLKSNRKMNGLILWQLQSTVLWPLYTTWSPIYKKNS